MGFQVRGSRWAGLAVTVCTLVTAAMLATSEAYALDYDAACAHNRIFWEVQQGQDDYTLNLKCGSTHSMTVWFNAKVTQADKDAGGFIWTLTCAGNGTSVRCESARSTNSQLRRTTSGPRLP